jgi:hypothetical protein
VVSRNGPEVYMCAVKFQLKLLRNGFISWQHKSRAKFNFVFESLQSSRSFTSISDFLGIFKCSRLDFCNAKIAGALLL